MKYLQLKNGKDLETIDELNPKNFRSFKDFRAEMARLIGEYRMAMQKLQGELYWSTRPCKNWLAR